MNTKELEILLVFSNNQRIPYLENEIFANEKLSSLYLIRLSNYNGTVRNVRLAYYYASTVMRCRWPEAEHIIATDPWYAYCYAYVVIKDRWPKAETVIATHPAHAYTYAKYVIKGRWPEAEAIIVTDHEYAYYYNHFVMTL